MPDEDYNETRTARIRRKALADLARHTKDIEAAERMATLVASAASKAIRDEIDEMKKHACKFSEEDRATLAEFAQSLRKTKATALTTIVGGVVAFIFGALLLGFAAKLKALAP